MKHRSYCAVYIDPFHLISGFSSFTAKNYLLYNNMKCTGDCLNIVCIVHSFMGDIFQAGSTSFINVEEKKVGLNEWIYMFDFMVGYLNLYPVYKLYRQPKHKTLDTIKYYLLKPYQDIFRFKKVFYKMIYSL